MESSKTPITLPPKPPRPSSKLPSTISTISTASTASTISTSSSTRLPISSTKLTQRSSPKLTSSSTSITPTSSSTSFTPTSSPTPITSTSPTTSTKLTSSYSSIKSLNPFISKTPSSKNISNTQTSPTTSSTLTSSYSSIKSFNPFISKTQSNKNISIKSPNPIKLTNPNKSNIQQSIEKNNKLLLISYNEGEEDFDQNDIIGFWNKLKEKYPEDPSVVIVCTQKSKSQVMIAVPGMKTLTGSNSTKHFPHVIGNFLKLKGYVSSEKLKRDASTMIRGISENNNVRTRIYIKLDSNFKIYEDEFISKLSVNTVGQFSTMSVNRQAIYYEIKLNNKKIIIVNTELASYNNGDFGLSDRQKEFMGLIKEFKLHEKYNNDYNIIFCGSLNFKLNPLKMINTDNKSKIYKVLKEKIEQKYRISNKDLLKYNELKVYIENLISKINNKSNKDKIINIIGINEYTKINKTEELYKELLRKFSASIITIGIKLTCDYELIPKDYRVFHPLKLGSIVKNSVKSLDSVQSAYKEKGFVSGMYTGTKSVTSSLVKPITPYTTQDFNSNQKKGFKIPSMCDRILFALHDDYINYEYFGVYDNLKKSKNRIIYSVFNF